MKFLNKLYDTIWKGIPRLETLQPDEAGVKVTLGKYEKVLGPGYYFLWEVFQQIHYLTVTPQWVDLRGQSVFAKYGVNMTVSGAIRYRITDARKALLSINDVDKSLATLALGIILEYVGKREVAECTNPAGLAEEILKGVREQASGWGVKVMEVKITDWGTTQNLRVIMNDSTSAIVPVVGDMIDEN